MRHPQPQPPCPLQRELGSPPPVAIITVTRCPRAASSAASASIAAVRRGPAERPYPGQSAVNSRYVAPLRRHHSVASRSMPARVVPHLGGLDCIQRPVQRSHQPRRRITPPATTATCITGGPKSP